MSDNLPRYPIAIEGDVLPSGALLPAVVAREIDRRPEPGTWTVHYVDLPGYGRIEGMDRADALRLAAELGTRAYAARAQLHRNGVVEIGVPVHIGGPRL